MDEVVHGEPRAGFAAPEQDAHVAADLGYPKQARLPVESRFNLLRRESQALKQIEDDAGIDRAGPRAHAETVERREPERAVHALSALHRAEAGPAAQVSHDDTAAGDVRRRGGQNRCDVLVREAVESVTPHGLMTQRP